MRGRFGKQRDQRQQFGEAAASRVPESAGSRRRGGPARARSGPRCADPGPVLRDSVQLPLAENQSNHRGPVSEQPGERLPVGALSPAARRARPRAAGRCGTRARRSSITAGSTATWNGSAWNHEVSPEGMILILPLPAVHLAGGPGQARVRDGRSGRGLQSSSPCRAPVSVFPACSAARRSASWVGCQPSGWAGRPPPAARR